MRQDGKTLADLHYYIPKNKADYNAIQAEKAAKREAAAKASAARRANADLTNSTPNSVPPTQGKDGFMFDADELEDEAMLDAAATIYPTNPSQTSSSSSSIPSTQVERVPTTRDSIGIYYDQFGRPMTVPEVKDYVAKHNLALQ